MAKKWNSHGRLLKIVKSRWNNGVQ